MTYTTPPDRALSAYRGRCGCGCGQDVFGRKDKRYHNERCRRRAYRATRVDLEAAKIAMALASESDWRAFVRDVMCRRDPVGAVLGGRLRVRFRDLERTE